MGSKPVQGASRFSFLPSSPLVVSCVFLGTWWNIHARTPVRRSNTIGRRARARTCHASFSNGLCRAASEGAQQREESSVMQNSREGLKNGGNAIQYEYKLIYNWGSGERLANAAEKEAFLIRQFTYESSRMIILWSTWT